MNVTIPYTITPDLATVNVLESLPAGAAVWASDTTFAKDAYVYTVRSGTNTTYDVFQSKANGNLGKPLPAADVSDGFWTAYGTVYKTYIAGTYAKGDIVTDSHFNYKSLADTNTALLTDTTKWQNIGPTNMTAAFDTLRNTQTKSTRDLLLTITIGKRVDSIALIGLIGTSVEVDISVGGVSKYHVATMLSNRNSRRWYQYYFGDQKQRTTVQYLNLPPFTNATITITVKRSTGVRAIGGVILGKAVYLGETQYSPTSDHLNFSTIDREFDGSLTLLARRSVPKVSQKIHFTKDMTDTLLQVRESTNGVPAFWSGLDDDFTDPYFNAVQTYGVAKAFSLDLSNFSYGILTLEVEEM